MTDKYVPDYLNTDLTIVDGMVVPAGGVKKGEHMVFKGVFTGSGHLLRGEVFVHKTPLEIEQAQS
jgi:hypothetical protein